MNLTLIPGDAFMASPWKNSIGITREVACRADAWCVSIADIDRDGPFSRFEGIGGLFMVLDGAGVTIGSPGVLRHSTLPRRRARPGRSPAHARPSDSRCGHGVAALRAGFIRGASRSDAHGAEPI